MKLSPSIDQRLRAEIDPGFAARARLIAERVAQLRPRCVLDAGCGRGFYPRLLREFDFIESVVGIDRNRTYVEAAASLTGIDKRVSIQQGDITALPLQDASVDFVIFSEVLEHLPDEHAALRELQRVLRPGGEIIVTVPCARFPFFWDPLNWLLMRMFGTHVPSHIHWLAGIWADHERLYGCEDLCERLRPYFKIEELQPQISKCWPFSHFLLYGIGKNIVERFGFGSVSRFSAELPGPFVRSLAALMRFPQDACGTAATETTCVGLVARGVRS